jgi:hypothetical protein
MNNPFIPTSFVMNAHIASAIRLVWFPVRIHYFNPLVISVLEQNIAYLETVEKMTEKLPKFSENGV